MAAACKLPQLSKDFGDRLRESDVLLAPAVTVHAGQRSEILHHLLDRLRVVDHHGRKPCALLIADPLLLQQLPRADDCSDAVLELVCDHAVEAAQPLLALTHAFQQDPHVLTRSDLGDHGDCAEQPVPAHHQLVLRTRALLVVCDLGSEVIQHAA